MAQRRVRDTLLGVIVRLTPLDEALTEDLLTVAVAYAEPDDVMPPVEGPPGWTDARRTAFRAFHRSHADGAKGTLMYAIQLRGETVGMIRLRRLEEPGTAETGMWLGRHMRSQGIGVDALRILLDIAAEAGIQKVRADTTPDNTAAIRALTRCGATLTTTPTKVTAEIPTHPTA